MTAPRAAPPAYRELAELGFDADQLLLDEPRVFLDGRLLGSLHRDLHAKLGSEAAAETLLQIGFIQGLRDARQVVRERFADRPRLSGSTAAIALPLAIRLSVPRRPSGDPGELEVHGVWPERLEAEARLSALGSGDGPGCFLSAGYTSGWLSGLHDADVVTLETTCAGRGDAECRFVAREADAWRKRAEPDVELHLRALPFEEFRQWIDSALRDLEETEESTAFDPTAPVVHVWGPVMVIPFCGADETLTAVELIGRDSGARSVSVVVVDLSGMLIDDGFGAAALERTLDAVATWGAETILAGVSPLSEPVVQEFEQRHVLVRKELPEAIAAAFQIASLQRRPA